MEIFFKNRKTKEIIKVPVCSKCLEPLKKMPKSWMVELMRTSNGNYLCQECTRKKEGKEE
jgi:hypothetical protein